MVRITTNKIAPLFLFILILGITGCIREDDSDCIRGIYIYFKTENPKHNYPDLVRTVDLYFYDEAGELAAQYFYNKEELEPSTRAALVEGLTAGKYTLVSIINDMENYLTIHEQQLESLQSNLKEKIIDYPLTAFFSGMLSITVERESGQQKAAADIFKHNNDIRLEIITDGYELPPGVSFNTFIEGNNGAYQHYNATWLRGHVIKYLPHRTEINNIGIPVNYDFTIMRLWRSADITLCLQEVTQYGGVTQSIRLNIPEELAKVVNDQNEFLYDTDEKLSFHDEYKIVVTLGPNFVLMELAINDWTIVRGGVDV